MLLPIRIEHALNAAIKCAHDADPREHRRAARGCDQEQRLHRSLPFRRRVLGLRELCDVGAGVGKGDEGSAARQRDGFVKPSLPAAIANGASPSCRIRF
jgi:hypothetical protein